MLQFEPYSHHWLKFLLNFEWIRIVGSDSGLLHMRKWIRHESNTDRLEISWHCELVKMQKRRIYSCLFYWSRHISMILYPCRRTLVTTQLVQCVSAHRKVTDLITSLHWLTVSISSRQWHFVFGLFSFTCALGAWEGQRWAGCAQYRPFVYLCY